jgi:hypothetical protein
VDPLVITVFVEGANFQNYDDSIGTIFLKSQLKPKGRS